MNTSILHYLFFSYFLGIGPVTFDKLVAHFGSVEALYTAKATDLRSVLRQGLVDQMISFRMQFDPEKEYARLQKTNVHVLTREDPRFPPQCKQLPDAPICLYAKGDLSNFHYERDLYFAIVGTRTPTDYGKQVAAKFAGELAQAGFVIVSGLARGIDAIAHRSTLDVKGRTVAFLGCGVDIVYPPSNARLYDEILAKGGLIISEFPPHMMVKPGLFVQRNRLISGLSKGVLVAEGLKDSGSLITARYALEQGKEVFAPPAPITSAQSEAPNFLIKEGAKMVTNIQDILEEFNMKVTPTSKEQVMASLSPEEQTVYAVLLQQAQTVDEIARLLKSPIHIVLMAISGMELKGVISKGSSGKYLLCM